MRKSWLSSAIVSAGSVGLLSVVLECLLFFSIVLWCIRNGLPRPELGITVAICALIPYGFQKIFKDVEAVLVSHTKACWIASLGLCAVIGGFLAAWQSGGVLLMMPLLCLASALFFLLFQIFELKLSILCSAQAVSAKHASTVLLLVMTVGSSIGGLGAGQLLQTGGLVAVGIASVMVSAIAILIIALAPGSSAEQHNQGTPADHDASTDTFDEPAPKAMPDRRDVIVAFMHLIALSAAPAIINFLLPWLVTQENGWTPAVFGRLDSLAAVGALIAVLIHAFGSWRHLRSIGVLCLLGAALALGRHRSIGCLALVCFLWGMGMSLARMQARQILFDAIRSSQDALAWSQRLGVGRVVVETSIPLVLGCFEEVSPSRLFTLSAWSLTGVLATLLAAEFATRSAASPVNRERLTVKS